MRQKELLQSRLQDNSCTKDKANQSQHTLLKINVRICNKHVLVYNLTTHLDMRQNEKINEQYYRHFGVGNITAVLYSEWKSYYNNLLYHPSLPLLPLSLFLFQLTPSRI